MKRLAVIVPECIEDAIVEEMVFIAQHSLENALAWEERLRGKILSLGEMWGYAVDEEASRRFGATVRRYVFEKNFLVNFTVDEKKGVVEIIGFRRGARLPGDRSGEN